MFRFINYNTYNNYNMIFTQNVEADSLRRQFENQHLKQRKKVFNPFRDAIVPDYKIEMNVQNESGKCKGVNDEDLESDVEKSNRSKDFSEITAIINEQ